MNAKKCKYEYTTDKDPMGNEPSRNLSHTIHVWYIYLHLVDSYGKW